MVFSSSNEDEPRQLLRLVPNNHRDLQSLKCDEEDYEKLINNDGYPHCYSCRVPPGTTVHTVRVSYDYEMAYDDSVNPSSDIALSVLPMIEWGVLDQVASDLHLRSCDVERQPYTDFQMIGLSSLYLDFRDLDVGTCQFLRQQQSPASSSSVTCAPISGSMIAHYTGEPSDEQDVQNALMDAIAKVMNDGRGISQPVTGILYVGDRGNPNRDFAASQEAMQNDDQGLARSTSIAVSASAISFIMVLVGAALLIRRRSSESKRPIEVPVADLECPPPARDCEIASSPPRDQRRNEHPSGISVDSEDGGGSLSVLGDVETADDTSTGAVAEPVEGEQNQPIAPPVINRSASATTHPVVETVNSADSSDSTTNGGLFEPAAPPKDSKSETLKKHRKKKKKKYKKVTLVRVNSRENVASMETISETDEQEQQDDLDDDVKRENVPVGGTYSTSDDQSSAYSTASSDNEEDFVEQKVERSASRSPLRRRDLPPLPPVEF